MKFLCINMRGWLRHSSLSYNEYKCGLKLIKDLEIFPWYFIAPNLSQIHIWWKWSEWLQPLKVVTSGWLWWLRCRELIKMPQWRWGSYSVCLKLIINYWNITRPGLRRRRRYTILDAISLLVFCLSKIQELIRLSNQRVLQWWQGRLHCNSPFIGLWVVVVMWKQTPIRSFSEFEVEDCAIDNLVNRFILS